MLAIAVHASASATSAALDISPALRPYVRAIPEAVAMVGSNGSTHLEIAVPASASPGLALSGIVQARTGRRLLRVPLLVTLEVVPSTPEGTLESLRAAIEVREGDWYAKQFVPERQQQERKVFDSLPDVSLDALARALRTAERVSLSDDGNTAEYRIVLLLGRDRTETTLTLRQGRDGIWRLAHF